MTAERFLWARFPVRELLASMGPRSDDRGKTTANPQAAETLAGLQWGRDLMTAERDMGFQAAMQADRLQWGRDLMTAESRAGHRATAVGGGLQWGRDLMTAESARDAAEWETIRCFNGAAI